MSSGSSDISDFDQVSLSSLEKKREESSAEFYQLLEDRQRFPINLFPVKPEDINDYSVACTYPDRQAGYFEMVSTDRKGLFHFLGGILVM